MQVGKRYHVQFVLVLFDIDHFKRVNDTFGHQTGDDVLVELAGLVKKQIREVDFLARWGGEEFVLLLAHLELHKAQGVLENLRLKIENHTFPDVRRLTCSFGATAFRKDDDEKSLIERADKALYQAKEMGRNQVRIF